MSITASINIYYLLALIAFLWMMWRYRGRALLLLFLCIGFEGTIMYWVPGLSAQIMRVVYVLWVTYLFVQKIARGALNGKMLYLIWTFVAFSVYFICGSFIINGDTFLMTFSQYSKYYVPFVIMLILGSYHSKNSTYTIYLNKFFGEYILIQIVSAIVKYVLFRFHYWEGMVGTFGGLGGGGAGTSFPLVALAWVLVNTNMEIKSWKSWLFVLGLLMIGVATGKRAVIFLYPAFFLLFALYVAKRRLKKGVLITIALAPLLMYLGLRLTPTLNPEHKVWGSFNPKYALSYAEDYSMGKDNRNGDRGEGNGRVGAAILMAKRSVDVDNYTFESWFGNGLSRIYSYQKGTYDDREYNFGVNHRGSMTGFVMMYLSIGLIGWLLFMIYYWFYFVPVKYWRLRLSLYVLVMFDFIFYNAMMIREPILAITLLCVMYYSRLQYTPSGNFVGKKHSYFQ